MRHLLFLFGLTISFLASSQLTIILESIPSSTPSGAEISVAGNFQVWQPGTAEYTFALNENDELALSFTPSLSDLAFKFTRGSWATVEGNADGGFLPDRQHAYTGLDTLRLSILSWEDLDGGGGSGSSTAGDGVAILDDNFYIPQLDRNRRIWIYLPPDYETSGADYRVIYMHDGQNLFDVETAFAGEWEVDETLDELHALGDPGAIVVGIENGGADRIDEYSPWVNTQYGGGDGDDYMDFIVETLKPYVDENYRTKSERDHTAIMGSSLGGLISQYAILQHQDVFSKAGLFSPSYWFAPACFDLVEIAPFDGNSTRVYQIMAIPEGQVHVDNVLAMDQAFLANGFDEVNVESVIHTSGAHSEWYWAREFGEAYQWLFSETVSIVEHDQKEIKIAPNPVGNRLRLKGNNNWADACDSLDIVDVHGRTVASSKIMDSSIDVSTLSPGSYILRLHWKDGQSTILRMLKA